MLIFTDLPETMQLLMLLTRWPLLPEEIEQARALIARQSGTTFWEEFLELSVFHRLDPLVFENLTRAHVTGVPPALTRHLHALATENAFEAVKNARTADVILQRLRLAGFPAINIKGVAFAQMVYGSPTTRHVGDIDLLSVPEQLPEQIRILEELGWTRSMPTGRLTPARLACLLRTTKGFTFTNQEGTHEIDLHWRLFSSRNFPFSLSPEDVTEEYELFGVHLRILAWENQLFYIGVHGAFDNWHHLKSLVDLAAMLRQSTPEQLDRVLQRAEEMNLLPHLAAGIFLCNAWLGSAVESSRLNSYQSPLTDHLLARFERLLLEQKFRPVHTYSSSFGLVLTEFQMLPGLRCKLDRVEGLLWRPRLWTAVDLPDALFGLYPLLNLFLPPRSGTTP